MKENAPCEDHQSGVEIGEKNVIQNVTSARYVGHKGAEDVALPETVRFVHQLAHLVVIKIQLIDLIILASRRSRLCIGQLFDFIADRLEALADHQTDQIEVCHYQVVYIDEKKVPDNLKHHPREEKVIRKLTFNLTSRLQASKQVAPEWRPAKDESLLLQKVYKPRNPHAKCSFAKVFVGCSESLIAHNGSRAERNAQNQKDRDINANIVHRMVHGDAGISNLQLFDRQERYDPVQFAFIRQEKRTTECGLKTEKKRRHQVVHTI